MFIKTVRVKGLLSYNEEVEVKFERGMNVIVGPNGSGKSNLIKAIQLAVTDEFRSLSQKARRELLFNGRISGARSPAYVEILFDNADGRLPVEGEIVVFRRQFGLKNDHLHVNGRKVPDARMFIQIAGFNNPYFVVKQGQVNSIAVATDAKRLGLLKDISGISLITSNMVEGAAKAEEARLIRQEVTAGITSLNERITQLEAERRNLEEASALDVDKRSIEYVLENAEVLKLKERIGEIEEKLGSFRREWLRLHSSQQKEIKALEIELQEIDEINTEMESKLSKYEAFKVTLDEGIDQLILEKEQLRQKITDLHCELKENRREKTLERLSELRMLIQAAETELTQLSSEYDQLIQAESKSKGRWLEADTTLKQSEEKFKRVETFQTIERRNAWIHKEVRKLNIDKLALEKNVEGIEERTEGHRAAKQEQIESVGRIREEFQQLRNDCAATNSQKHEFTAQLMDLKRSLREKVGFFTRETEDHAIQVQNENKYKEMLMKCAGRPIILGIEGVQNVCEQLWGGPSHYENAGYYGTILHNITCPEDIHLAVEAAAGAKIFYHVVKDRSISLRIMKEFNNQKLPGEVYFIPLDKLNTKFVTFAAKPNVFHLLDQVKLRHESVPAVRRAVEYVFGRTLLCKDLHVATCAAKEHRLNCVTTDGDKVESIGTLRGGYIKLSSSKIYSFLQWIKTKNTIQGLQETIEKLEQDKIKIQAEVASVTERLEMAGVQNSRYRNNLDASLCQQRIAQSKLQSIIEAMEKEENMKRDCKHRIDEINLKIVKLNGELTEDLQLPTDEDLREIQSLRLKVKELSRSANQDFKSRVQKEQEINTIRQNLDKLRREENELQGQQLEAGGSGEDQLKHLTEAFKELQQNLQHKEKVRLALTAKSQSLEAESQRLREDVDKKVETLQRLLEENSKENPTVLALTSKLKNLQQTLEDKKHTGVMPANVNLFKAKSKRFLTNKLKEINCRLKDLHVNVAKMGVFSKIESIRAEVTAKMEELDLAQQSLDQIEEWLNQEKQGWFIQFFVQLQRHFKAVFQKLVPEGHAHLVLYGDDFEFSEPDTEVSVPSISDDKIIGVSIRLSFRNSSETGETQNMMQLSGGQKSVVAIALILALQNVHPVPMYLLDEIDQALDPSYREAVAEYIRSTSDQAQFICTTFRREFVEHATSHFGVIHRNNGSTVMSVKQNDALAFVRDDNTNGSGTDDITLSDLSAQWNDSAAT